MPVHMAHRTPFVNRFFINELVGMGLAALFGCGTDVCASEQAVRPFTIASGIATC